MNILIGDSSKLYRLKLKSYIHTLWPEAIVYEEGSLDAVVVSVFAIGFDLLLLDINLPGSDDLHDFVRQAVLYTKVVICCEEVEDNPKARGFLAMGTEAFLLKSAKEEDTISTLLFVFSEI